MSECAFSRYVCKGDNAHNLAGRLFNEVAFSFVAHSIAAHIIGTSILRPALVGSFYVGCGFSLSLADHQFFRDDDVVHHVSHRLVRACLNAFLTLQASKYLFPVNWKWPVMSVGISTFFCELERTERRSRGRH
ncbi:MAG: hypothetical protein HRU43_08050 [Simkaniaceae bacterium]|nr:hypothetical protein [Simkaniaceae bacterium]